MSPRNPAPDFSSLRRLSLLSATALCALALHGAAQAAEPPWTVEGFEAFRGGSFGNAGQNLYVSRAGVLQRIHRFDVNGDGFFDLPFANCQEHHESAPSYVYDAATGARLATLPGQGALCGAVADLDGDGTRDVVVAGHHDMVSPFAAADVYFGGADGLWGERRHVRLQSPRALDCTVGRFDATGRPAIVFAMPRWGFVRVYAQSEIFPPDPSKVRHNVAGSALKRPDAGGLRWIAVADLNGDGWLDVALPAIRPRSYVLWGGPDGFDASRRQEFATGPSASARVADLDGDGRPELLFGSHTMQASGDGDRPARQPHHSYLHVYWNGEDGFSESRKCILRADAVTAFCMGDFDGDGWLDVFCGSYQGEVDRDINSFLYWNRGGSFSNTNRLDLVTHAASGCVAADFDGDGRLDLAVANHKTFGDHVSCSDVWWNGPDGFLPNRTTKLPTRGPHGMSAVEPGDVLSRGPVERWTSAPHRVGEAATVGSVDVEADCPPKTWVAAEARAAATEDALEGAEWRDPAGLAVPAGGFLQLRLGLGAESSLSTSRLRRVTTTFR